jgi:hypothetical protein
VITHRLRFPAVVLGVALVVSGCAESETVSGSGSAEGALEGTFAIDAGECSDASVTKGSWFRMVQPGGTVADGPFVINGDSPCGDTTWTPLSPGSDGGLTTGTYQPQPAEAFDADGNGAATAITQPQTWFAVNFAIATNETDPQTNTKTSVPQLTAENGKLSGDLSAWAAAWNGQHFNQGAPKPGGDMPGETRAPTGTYDDSSGFYSLEWSSQIIGGPVNNFTGVWHLEGTYEA